MHNSGLSFVCLFVVTVLASDVTKTDISLAERLSDAPSKQYIMKLFLIGD